ncbi:MAG: helix-turn-helix domain-containing protein [Desulfobulbia bacterium]
MDKNNELQFQNISSFLKAINLSGFQKLSNFHILRIDEHEDVLPKNILMRSGDYFEFSFAVDSSMDVSLGGKQYKMENNHLYCLSPNQSVHLNIVEPNEAKDGYMLLFTPEFLNFHTSEYNLIQRFPYFNIHLSPVFNVSKVHSDLFIQYLKQIYNEFQILDDKNIEILKSYLTILLFEVNRIIDTESSKLGLNTRVEQITYRFENLIKETKQKNQKLEYYSSQLNISSIYLSECVKKATGETAKKIITRYLISEAKSMISVPDNTIEVIAFQLGFNDTSNFINFFKKQTRMTPSKFRKQIAGYNILYK